MFFNLMSVPAEGNGRSLAGGNFYPRASLTLIEDSAVPSREERRLRSTFSVRNRGISVRDDSDPRWEPGPRTEFSV